MLNNLKKMLNDKAESDLQVDLMLEAVNDSIADMFIEDDGEIEMSEDEIMGVLDKIPAYDEEKELNKKLDRIAESYIPEEIIIEGFGSIKQKINDIYTKHNNRKKTREIVNSNKKAFQNMLANCDTVEMCDELGPYVLAIADNQKQSIQKHGGEDPKTDEMVQDFVDWLEGPFLNKVKEKRRNLK